MLIPAVVGTISNGLNISSKLQGTLFEGIANIFLPIAVITFIITCILIFLLSKVDERDKVISDGGFGLINKGNNIKLIIASGICPRCGDTLKIKKENGQPQGVCLKNPKQHRFEFDFTKL